MNVFRSGVVAISVALLLLQGCSGSQTRPEDVVVEDRSLNVEETQGEGQQAVEGGRGAESQGLVGGEAFSVEALSNPDSPLSNRIFYFDYNSSDLEAADQARLEAHARFISLHPEVSVVVEGHADERGSREYNLALSERRAHAIERLLSLQGAASGQMQVIGFGEERPVALGSDDASWRLNRRVELLYSGY